MTQSFNEMSATTEMYSASTATFMEDEAGNASFSNNTNPFVFTYDPFKFDYLDILEIGILGAIGLIAAPCNFVLILVQLQLKEKASTDYFITTLAAFDLFGATFNVAMHLMHTGLKKYVLSPVFCKLMVYGAYFVSFESAFLIGAIAVDRFIMAILPLNKIYNAQIAKIVCICLSVTSCCLTLPYFFLLTMHPTLFYCAYVEGVATLMDWWNRGLIFLIALTFVTVITSYLSIAVMLIRRHTQAVRSKATKAKLNISCVDNSDTMGFTVKETSKEVTSGPQMAADRPLPNNSLSGNEARPCKSKEKAAKKDQKEKARTMQKVTMIMFLISVMYMISWGAASSVIATNFTLPPEYSRYAHLLRRSTMVSNPILYMSLSSKFKSTAKRLFCKH